jgi:hypothetical protein
MVHKKKEEIVEPKEEKAEKEDKINLSSEKNSNDAKASKKEMLADMFKEIEKEIKSNSISLEQLYAWFKEEIDRKDKELTRLREENHVLFMTALKAKESQLFSKEMKGENKKE